MEEEYSCIKIMNVNIFLHFFFFNIIKKWNFEQKYKSILY